MNRLPKLTQLPEEPVVRRHDPADGESGTYRPCARWDFGFTCALCLLHEADLVDFGAEGTGLISLEHHKLKKAERTDLKDNYTNLILGCRYCNGRRGQLRSTDPDSGAQLLDPTSVGWAKHFEFKGFELKPLADDLDAGYTWKAYDLGAKRKAAHREARHDFISEWEEDKRLLRDRVPKLLELSHDTTVAEGERRLAAELAETYVKNYENTKKKLQRYVAVPFDAPTKCRCDKDSGASALPEWLVQQLVVEVF